MIRAPVVEGGGGSLLKTKQKNYTGGKIMLLTVKKQVEQTVELKTPAYYKYDLFQKHYFIAGDQIVVVSSKMIYVWGPDMGKAYTDEIMHAMDNGQECTKEEFDKAYAAVFQILEAAVGVVTNS